MSYSDVQQARQIELLCPRIIYACWYGAMLVVEIRAISLYLQSNRQPKLAGFVHHAQLITD